MSTKPKYDTPLAVGDPVWRALDEGIQEGVVLSVVVGFVDERHEFRAGDGIQPCETPQEGVVASFQRHASAADPDVWIDGCHLAQDQRALAHELPDAQFFRSAEAAYSRLSRDLLDLARRKREEANRLEGIAAAAGFAAGEGPMPGRGLATRSMDFGR